MKALTAWLTMPSSSVLEAGPWIFAMFLGDPIRLAPCDMLLEAFRAIFVVLYAGGGAFCGQLWSHLRRPGGGAQTNLRCAFLRRFPWSSSVGDARGIRALRVQTLRIPHCRAFPRLSLQAREQLPGGLLRRFSS